MKLRLFKTNDGTIRWVVFPWKKKKENETDEQFMDRMSIDHKNFSDELKKLSYIDLLRNEFPHPDYSKGEEDEMLYFDGELKKENLKKDLTFEIQLMRSETIKKKYLKKLNEKLDSELNKSIPDPILILKTQREKEKSKDWTEDQWYQQAIKNLDERVIGGESDKPIIRQKILNKIRELS